MTGSTLHIGYLKQPVSENIQCRNIMDEAKSGYEYVKQMSKVPDNDVTMRDSFEKTVDVLEKMYLNYSDQSAVKGMPKSIFGDRFGWNMDGDIYDCMQKFYDGKIGEQELEEYFGLCCTSMRLYRVQQRQTNGKNEDDNLMIINDMYDIFAKKNMLCAQYANYLEGEKINLSYGKRTNDWAYYNADYYYKCEETKDKLRQIAENMAAKWGISSFDAEEVEKNTKYTVNGRLDFNSGWNFHFRNQAGRSSIAKEAVVPPRGFKMFFKESVRYLTQGDDKDIDSIGILEISTEKNRYSREVLFGWFLPGIEGLIYDVGTLMKDDLSKEDDSAEFIDFLRNFSVFTRGYSGRSGLIDRCGDYMPRELKNRW